MASNARGLISVAIVSLLAIAAIAAIIMADSSRAPEDWDFTLVDAESHPIVIYTTTSIALDSFGTPHIGYRWICQDAAPWFSVKLASLQSESWDASFVDGGGNVHSLIPTSIAIDDGGSIHMGYSNITSGERSVRYANNTAGEWAAVEVSDGEGIGALCLDSEGTVHMCWAVEVGLCDALVYANNSGGFWISEIVDEFNHSTHASIAIDDNGHVHIAYTVYDGDYSVLYTTNGDGAWNSSIVGPGRWEDIALDSDNAPHVAYVRESQDAVVCASLVEGVWEDSTLDTGEGTYALSIAIGPNDGVNLCYSVTTDTSSTLIHATEIDDEWVESIVEHFEADLPFLGSASIAVGVLGDVHICYVRCQLGSHDDGGGLKYATLPAQEIPEMSQLGLPFVVLATVTLFLVLGRAKR